MTARRATRTRDKQYRIYIYNVDISLSLSMEANQDLYGLRRRMLIRSVWLGERWIVQVPFIWTWTTSNGHVKEGTSLSE